MSPLYVSRAPRRSTATSVTLWPLLSVTSRSAFACVISVTLSWVSAGRTHRTCASAFPSVRQGKPSNRSQRTQRPASGSDSFRSTPTGRWNGRCPVFSKSSDSCWMRGSCDTGGYGNGAGARRLGRVLARLPVHEVELLRL